MKRKRLLIAGELLVDFLKNPVSPGLMQDGLPADAKIVGASWGDDQILTLVLQSESFDPVVGITDCPTLTVSYRKN